jgi:hypothetical protein
MARVMCRSPRFWSAAAVVVERALDGPVRVDGPGVPALGARPLHEREDTIAARNLQPGGYRVKGDGATSATTRAVSVPVSPAFSIDTKVNANNEEHSQL